tara:strand:+ start:3803 stop:5428 length:1626 start_codon:yes stop_codon:yes gene_type:complete
MALSKTNIGRIAEDGAITTDTILNNSIVNADVSPSAAIGTGKHATGFKTQAEATTDFNTRHFNIALLGFKMAVNDSLTVFNLVDGVVDEFHDESGTDEGEGSNDTYCSSNDNYVNQTNPGASYSAGFTMTTRTESDTSTAGANPTQGTATFGTFTVPSNVNSVDIKVWGAGADSNDPNNTGGAGGFAEGTLATTASQVLHVIAGEGGGGNGNGRAAGYLGGANSIPEGNNGGVGGAGLAGVFSVSLSPLSSPQYSAPTAYVVAGSGGGGNFGESGPKGANGGAGGGLTGDAGDTTSEQVASHSGDGADHGGGGDQEQGGVAGGGLEGPGQAGGLFRGGNAGGICTPETGGAGGAGYYGGGGGRAGKNANPSSAGGGGSSYHGHPQVTSGSTEEGSTSNGGGTGDPQYQSSTNEGGTSGNQGEDGFVLITGSASAVTSSTTIVSNAFTASSEPSTSRIVVFQEDIDSITLNTDLIASVSRDGGSNFSTVTLADEGYVTGASGQRILAGTVDISGQPSGTNMRWKLALANNASKVHGVSLSWG